MLTENSNKNKTQEEQRGMDKNLKYAYRNPDPDLYLSPNAVCAYCGDPFRQRPHLLRKQQRKGKLPFCGPKCAQKYYARERRRNGQPG